MVGCGHQSEKLIGTPDGPGRSKKGRVSNRWHRRTHHHRRSAALNERSREIFRQIVENYLASGDPLGSRNISRLLSMSLSPASVRNIMADLEQAGLIYAPHTSAGRLPTESGLRFFVDAMLEIGDLDQTERERIEVQMRAAAMEQNFEGALAQASTMLSGLSRGGWRRRHDQGGCSPQAHRIRAARSRQGPGGAGLRGRFRGKPSRRPAPRPAGFPRSSRPAISSMPA